MSASGLDNLNETSKSVILETQGKEEEGTGTLSKT